jgi:hypothetical protein
MPADPELKALLVSLNRQLARGIKAGVIYSDFEKVKGDIDSIRSKTTMS